MNWLRRHPPAADALLALAVLAAVLAGSVLGRGVSGDPLRPSFVALSVAASACLLAHRRASRLVLVLTCGCTVLAAVATGDGRPHTQIAVTVAVALYIVTSRTERPAAWWIAALTVGTLTPAVMLLGPPPWYSQENIGLVAWTGMAAAIGDAARSRRAFVAAIQERALRAEAGREEEARRRVTEERLRIARELHDVVAHLIALVNVQAGVASHVMDSRPDQAKEALAQVRQASRSALEELRSTVGLLRQYGDPEAPTEPAPGLNMLGQLVDGFTRAGLEVAVRTEGPMDQLPAAVDLTAYRVIQEALTNAHKHAGAGARAEVAIRRGLLELVLMVLDDGGQAGAAMALPAGGHGLTGMRERVTALGGRIETGPRRDTPGFQVEVRLPVPAATRR
ncbi:sensor histidine kinase [Streptomyces sp. NPDC052396]|uniref:sensor histidine kinase n=1 Tax=Streptomyces sp. NPDC052396 TaxID=3365689 RepID=UPI0037D0A930